MKDRHKFNRDRKSRRPIYIESPDNTEIEDLRKARQNWQEWENIITVPWSKTIH